MLKEFLQHFKKKSEPSEFKYSELELAHLNGFSKGLELGIQLASEVDSKVREKIKNQSIQDTLERLNGNHQTHN